MEPRILKFRAWSEKFGGMIYPEDSKYNIRISASGGVHSVWEDARDDEGVPIMQFTGLKDKNGKEIYEGDIIEFDAKEWGNDKGNKWQVKWDESKGAWNLGGGASHSSEKQFRTVIGNIYEHVHLLNP